MAEQDEFRAPRKRRRGPYNKATSIFEPLHVASCMTLDSPISYTDRDDIPSSFKEKDNIDECVAPIVQQTVQDNSVFVVDDSIAITTTHDQDEETIAVEKINNISVPDEEEDEIDQLMEEIFKETKLRHGDILVNDADITNTVHDRTETLDHITEIMKQSSEIEKECQTPNVDHEGYMEDCGSRKLFPDSPHSLGLTMLLICCLMIRFRLPDEASSYILRVIACLLPHGHRLPGSYYHVRQFLKEFTQDMLPTIHYYCNFCYTSIDKTTKMCNACGKDLSKSGGVAYFVHLKIVSQLRALWKINEFESEVRSHRFNHIKNNKNGLIKDIYDWKLYQKLFKENGILSDKNNLSFSMNTDGVPLFKSSKVGMWPVYMLINELPISKRKKRHNALFYGVWISSKKPQMWSFLEPLFHELKHLETCGETFVDSTGYAFNCKCVLLTCTCDLPARAMVYNCNQFNGEYSCWFCLEKGKTHKLETGGICHVYPFDHDQPKGTPRTQNSVLSDVMKVTDNVSNNIKKITVNGHKGPFWFLYLQHFDAIHSCIIDYMHGICLGVTKLLLTLWFDASHKKKTFFTFYEKRKSE